MLRLSIIPVFVLFVLLIISYVYISFTLLISKRLGISTKTCFRDVLFS